METRLPRETLNLRIKPELRDLIDRAAAALGKTRTDFVLDASRQAAEDAMLDRALFSVDDQTYRTFLARLEAAPQPNPRLLKTMTTPAPWDRP